MINCADIARERGDLAAAEACAGVGEHQACSHTVLCPLQRVFEKWEQWGIPERERRLLRADLLRTVPLQDRPALVAMRRLLTAGRALVVLGGKCGTGKTVAATWALSRRGGRYVRAHELARVGVDLAPLVAANTLVIDQVGCESMGQSDWALGQFLDVIDARYSALRLTILCANMARADMERRYTAVFARRLRDDGEFVKVEATP